MKSLKLMRSFVALFACLLLVTSCKETKSYAELLDEENKAVKEFLKTQTVINEIPADSVFIVG